MKIETLILNIATALSLMIASCLSFWQQNLMGGLGYLIATGYFLMYKKEEQKNYEN
jgi:hypothetical protein